MAGLIKIGKFAANKIANKNSLGVIIRSASHWNKDWKPGPYPETQAEREAAAKKYGIPIEDYKTYENDGTGHGDYPKLDDISVERRDPYYPYDFPESKRNFGDVYHVDADLYSEDRYNNSQQRYSMKFMVLSFLTVIGASAAIYIFLEDYKTFRPVAAKQFPRDGKVHYTFEAPH